MTHPARLRGGSLLAALLLSSSACVTHFMARPALSGRVLQAATPLSSATVSVCTFTDDDPATDGCPRQATATTDAEGRFAFPELRESHQALVNGGGAHPYTELFVCLPGAPRPVEVEVTPSIRQVTSESRDCGAAP